MGGGLLQLVAYGAQDIYLTGNPQITFFKVVYRRHTNFALESIENTFNGNPGFNKRVTCQISRNGDLIHRMYLQIDLPNLAPGAQWVDFVGLKLLKDVEIEIGGQRIDKHYPQWMYIWNQLSLPHGKTNGYAMLTGGQGFVNAQNSNTLYVPLEFWFCRNVGLSLPLIALQYHEVKINIDFEQAAYLIACGAVPTSDITCNLWVDYVYLDTDERRRFAQLSHEYLIEQLQFTGSEPITSSGSRIKLNFNHPCKELVWAVQLDSVAASSNQWTNFSASPTSAYPTFTNPSCSNLVDFPTNIQLNGQDRFNVRDGLYFNLVQPFQHHENVPSNPGINVYSFALKPEEHQPSGTLNLSRIDTAVLSLSTPLVTATNTAKAYIYAVNYNVLRIMSGMGGLAYSN
jgi:hypothetical protein